MMTPEELRKIREMCWAKSIAQNDPAPWRELCESLGIRVMSKLTHICAPPELGEVRIPDPFGSYLSMSEDTARKILVLGL